MGIKDDDLKLELEMAKLDKELNKWWEHPILHLRLFYDTHFVTRWNQIYQYVCLNKKTMSSFIPNNALTKDAKKWRKENKIKYFDYISAFDGFIFQYFCKKYKINYISFRFVYSKEELEKFKAAAKYINFEEQYRNSKTYKEIIKTLEKKLDDKGWNNQDKKCYHNGS